MQRRLLLLLFFVSSFGVHAMEYEYQSSFMALQPFPPTCFGNVKVLTPFQEAQESKNKFEAQLQLKWSWDGMLQVTKGSFTLPKVKSNPIEFLKYCYHQKRHYVDKTFPVGLSNLDQDVSLLNTCKNTCIDGYSALGAAILAEDTLVILNKNTMETQYKPYFIFKLLQKGFRFTEKDKILVALHLHDVISAEQKQMMISLLCEPQEGNLALLPHDVRKYIVNYIVHLHKKSDWLCSFLNRF